MSIAGYIEAKCDKCGLVERATGGPDVVLPSFWIAVKMGAAETLHTCPTCTRKLREWFGRSA
jgi:hypothetical protein